MSVDAVPRWLAGRRPPPTFEALLGAAGGVVLLGAATAFAESVPDDDARVAGLALSLLVLVAGLVLSVLSLGRATTAAGVVLAAGAVAPLAFLLTNDPDRIDERSDFLVAALVAVVFWLLLFALGPNRGHGLFLGLALFMLWAGAMSQTAASPFFFNIDAVSGEADIEVVPDEPMPDFQPPEFEVPEFEPAPIPDFRAPGEPGVEPAPLRPAPRPMPTFRFRPPPPPPSDATTTTTASEDAAGRLQLVSSSQELEFDEEPRPPVAGAVVSVLFGIAYLLFAALLDASRLWRPASVTFLVALLALVTGTVMLGPRYGATAAGVVGVALAVLVVGAGVVASRRAVAWVGAAGLALGAITVVSSVFDDSATAAAVVLLVVGAGLVTLGLLATTPDYQDAEVP